MSKDEPAWRDQARALHAKGATVTELAAYFGKSRSTISYALDLNGSRDKARERKRAERQSSGYRDPVARKFKAVEPAPVVEEKPVPSLPVVSILTKPMIEETESSPRRLAFTPIIVREAPGVDRWRSIHREMKRRGKIPDRAATLVGQFHA